MAATLAVDLVLAAQADILCLPLLQRCGEFPSCRCGNSPYITF